MLRLSLLFIGLISAILGQALTNDLFGAAARGDLSALKTLIRGGANVNARGAHGRTPLHEAAANCQTKASELLVASGGDSSLSDDQDVTPLELAVDCLTKNGPPKSSNVAVVSNTRPAADESLPWSLQYAAGRKQAAVITLLLNAGADVNNVGSEGNRALDIACLKGDTDAARVLLVARI